MTGILLLALVLANAGGPLPVPENVPELMTTFSGEKVTTREAWEKVRKPEIRKFFLESMYGVRPAAAEHPDVSFEPSEPDKVMLDGKALRKRTRITYRGPYGTNSFVVTAFIPQTGRPAPSFVLICNRDPKKNLDPERNVKSGFWPVEQLVDRGYAAIAFFNGDVAKETYNPATAFLNGVFPCYERPEDREDMSWGVLSAWAWGASRVMDWIETEPLLDAKHVGVVGHSRGGKTSLLAGATDERFAMTCVNCSGCGGAKLAHIDLPESEYYAIFLSSRVTYWFCGRYQRVFMNCDRPIRRADAWGQLLKPIPVDQHEWAALVAPRLLAIASATEDAGAGPLGEFHTARLASPAWELYGRRGLAADAAFPAPDAPIRGGDVSYHIRTGEHDLTPYDWNVYMDFADAHGWRPGTFALTAPKDGETVPLLTDAQKGYLDLPRTVRTANFSNGTCRAEMRADRGWQRPVRLEWTGTEGPCRVALQLDGREVAVTNLFGNSVSFDNLEIARTYRWSVSCGGESRTASFVTEGRAPRFMRVRGVPNVRDLGGRVGLGGRRVRQGLVYRTAGLNDNATAKCYTMDELRKFHADGKLFGMFKDGPESNDVVRLIRHLEKGDADFKRHARNLFPVPNGRKAGRNRLDDATKEYLVRTLGIRSDIDLRSDNECWGMTGSPIGSDVTWFQYSSACYGSMQKDWGREPFAKVFRVFLDRKNYGIVFHCIGGRDRTGSVAFILNGLLGVEEEELWKDWEATGFSDGDLGFNHGLFVKLVDGFKANWPGATLCEKLENYVKSLGFTEADIATFREIMLEEK